MDLLSNMLNILRKDSDTDKQFRLLREKLIYNIKKGEAALIKYQKERHVQAWVAQYLQNRLQAARDKLTQLDALLTSSEDQGMSLKDKFKLSLPFNNERDKINQIADDLKNASEDVMNGNIHRDPPSGMKRKLKINDKDKENNRNNMKREREREKQELQVDNQTEAIYEMSPTLKSTEEYTRIHGVELRVEAQGSEAVLKVLEGTNRLTKVDYSCQWTSQEASIDLYKLGCMNFKEEYKALKQVYPDIGKISKNAHFTIKWERTVPHVDRSQLSESSNKKSQANHLETSQKIDDSFFSVAEVEISELTHGKVVLEKEARSLFRKLGEKWVKVEERVLEVSNGQEVAVCLGKELRPDLFFKITYEWK